MQRALFELNHTEPSSFFSLTCQIIEFPPLILCVFFYFCCCLPIKKRLHVLLGLGCQSRSQRQANELFTLLLAPHLLFSFTFWFLFEHVPSLFFFFLSFTGTFGRVCVTKKTNKTKRKRKKEGIYRRGSFWCDKEHNTEDNLARETRPSRERVPAFFIHRLDKPESFSLLSFEIIRLYKIKLLKTSDSNHFAAFFSISSLSSGWGKGMFIRRNGGVPVWQEPKKKKKEFDITKYPHSTHTHTQRRERHRHMGAGDAWRGSYVD